MFIPTLKLLKIGSENKASKFEDELTQSSILGEGSLFSKRIRFRKFLSKYFEPNYSGKEIRKKLEKFFT